MNLLSKTLFLAALMSSGLAPPAMAKVGDGPLAIPNISISDATTTEGNSGAKVVVFTVSLSAPSSSDVGYMFGTAEVNAVGNDDFQHAYSSPRTIPAGQTSQTFEITIYGDTVVETDETFQVLLENVTNATVLKGVGTGTIVNDDSGASATLLVGDVQISEGNSGTKTANVTVQLSKAAATAVSFNIATANGTATSGSDYTALNLTNQSIPAGQLSKTFAVTITGDATVEGDETFTVNLSNASGAAIGRGQALGIIVNDDNVSSVKIQVSDLYYITEGSSGTKSATFFVSMSKAATSTVSFDIKTEDSSAKAGSDYVAKALVGQTIAVGQTLAAFTVTVNGDTLEEPEERFLVTLSNVVNAAIEYGDTHGVGTIQNDDSTISIGDISKAEGDFGDTDFSFPVTLSAPLSDTVSFVPVTCDGTATSNSNDYWATGGTSIQQINAGQTSATVTIRVVGDTAVEPNETFCVDLTQVGGVAGGDTHAVATIVNDDLGPPTISVGNGSLIEGDDPNVNHILNIPLTFSNDAKQTVFLTYHTTGGTATSDVDYYSTSAGIWLPAGTTSYNLEVYVKADIDVEPNETFTLVLDSTDYGTLGNKTGTGTIINDDGGGGGTPALSIGDVSISEGNSGTKVATFTVSLSAAAAGAVTYDISTANGTATAGSDFVASSLVGQSIPAGQTSKTFAVTINGDATVESDENFTVNVSNVAGAAVVVGSAVGTITNDDSAGGPALSIADLSIAEGNSGTKTATFTVSLSAAQSGPVLFDIATANGTATSGSDYVAKTTAGVRIAAGSTSKTFLVTINGDTDSEADETFTVNLSNASGASIADGQAVGTISNDDAAPTPALSIGDASVLEGNSGTKQLDFTVSLSAPSNTDVAYDMATQSWTATGISDFELQSAHFIIPAGSISQTISITINGDVAPEQDETFQVNLSNISGNATLLDPQGIGTILDDDYADAPSLSIADASVAEGNSGSTDMVFTISLSKVAASFVCFELRPSSGSAIAYDDFSGSYISACISPGESSKNLAIGVSGDTVAELDETFTVNVVDISGANVADASAIGTIINDDGAGGRPAISIADASIVEGNAGNAWMSFQVTLTAPAATDVRFNAATSDGTAQQPGDYVAQNWGNVLIPAGSTSTILQVPAIGDTTGELDETFTLTLSNVTGADAGDLVATGTITNDDTVVTPSLSVGDVSITEGNSGTKPMTFPITLSSPSVSQVCFNLQTTGGSASSGSDYIDAGANACIPAGQTSYEFKLSIVGDTVVEPDEFVMAAVFDVQGANIAKSSGTGTILNDDGASGPSLSINDVTVSEGNSATKTATFTVTLSAAQSAPVTVNVATASGTATSGSDYVAKSTTGLRFPAGSTSKTFAVTINGDTTSEPDETYTVNLSSPSAGVTISDGQAVGTITNDDAAATPTLSIADASVSEGNSGTKVLTFTVSLSPAAAGTVSYDIATSNGTATAGSDYVASSLVGQTISAGGTSKTFAVTINGDATTESNETFNVTLTNVSGATLGDGTAVGTITNDDGGGSGPTLSIGDVTVAEGNSLSKQVTFTVSLSAAASTAVTYNIATANGTATAPTDYATKSLTGQTIAAGVTSKTFVVAVKGDTVAEANETFTVNVTSVVGATVADGQAVGTITNDDAALVSVARFDARGLVDDIDDGNRVPQVSTNEYALLLADTANKLCTRTNAATVVGIDGVENAAVLRDLADATNAICAKTRYQAVMGEGAELGFLVEATADTDARGVQVLDKPKLDATAKLSSLQVQASGHDGPITLLLPQALSTDATVRNTQLRNLGQAVQAQLASEPQARLVLIGNETVPGMLDLTARSLPAKSTLPAERVLVSPTLLREFGKTTIAFPALPANEVPAQVLQLRR